MTEAELLQQRASLLQQLAETQAEIRRLGVPMVGLPPSLDENHVAGCRVFPSRYAILDVLPTGGRIAELGVSRGDFSKHLLSRLSPAELHLFDLSFKNLDRKFYDPLVTAGTVTLHAGDSSSLLTKMPAEYFDLIYIDGDHTVEGVARDIQVAKSRLKPDGLLGFNDYTLWSAREMIPYGVMQGVNRLCVKQGWKIIFLALSKDGAHDVFLRA